VVSAGDLRAHHKFFVPEVLGQVIPATRSVDVDSPQDLAMAERLAARMGWAG
jgi:N-acylneuraminate cytidylyltransferase